MQTFNWTQRAKSLRSTFNLPQFLTLCEHHELGLNDYVLTYLTSDRPEKHLQDLTTHLIGTGDYEVDSNALENMLEYMIRKTHKIHSNKPYRKVEYRPANGGDSVNIHKGTHSLMVSVMELLLSTYLSHSMAASDLDFGREESKPTPGLMPVALLHDLLEDMVKNGQNQEEAIMELDSIVSTCTPYDNPMITDAIIPAVRRLSRYPGVDYNKYVLGMFSQSFDHAEDRWLEPGIADLVKTSKISDLSHNGMRQGEFRNVYYSDDMFSAIGLSHSKRMEITLKAMMFLDPMIEWFDIISRTFSREKPLLPRQYMGLFDMTWIMHHIYLDNLNALKRGIEEEFIYNPQVPNEFRRIGADLDSAMEEYKLTKNISQVTEQKHDLEYYLNNEIAPDIYDGVLMDIARYVNTSAQPSYDDLTKPKKFTQAMVHLIGLIYGNEQTFAQAYDDTPNPRMQHLKYFNDLPKDIVSQSPII